MTYDKTKTGQRDRSRVDVNDPKLQVDMNDPNEVEYLRRRFPGKTHTQIAEAIKLAGPSRVNIVKHLRGKSSL